MISVDETDFKLFESLPDIRKDIFLVQPLAVTPCILLPHSIILSMTVTLYDTETFYLTLSLTQYICLNTSILIMTHCITGLLEKSFLGTFQPPRVTDCFYISETLLTNSRDNIMSLIKHWCLLYLRQYVTLHLIFLPQGGRVVNKKQWSALLVHTSSTVGTS